MNSYVVFHIKLLVLIRTRHQHIITISVPIYKIVKTHKTLLKFINEVIKKTCIVFHMLSIY
jgi:hypothetical protein